MRTALAVQCPGLGHSALRIKMSPGTHHRLALRNTLQKGLYQLLACQLALFNGECCGAGT
jgi:hypothetical protein